MRHHQHPYITYCLLLFFVCSLFQCAEDNYDLTQEIEGPHEPVMAEEGTPYVIIRSPAGVTTELSGEAATQPDGLSLLTTSPSGIVDCDLRFSGGPGKGGTIILFNLDKDGTAEPMLALSLEIQQPFFYAPTVSGGCSTKPRTMTIEESSPGILAGSYEGEFFYQDYDLPYTTGCSQLISMGVYTVEFSVPHTICP